MPPQPRRHVPYLDDQQRQTDADLGSLVRAAVVLVRNEGGYEGDDPEGVIEVAVTLRAPTRRKG